jgi:hypothetical protein
LVGGRYERLLHRAGRPGAISVAKFEKNATCEAARPSALRLHASPKRGGQTNQSGGRGRH